MPPARRSPFVSSIIRRVIQVIRQDPYQEAINDVQEKLDIGNGGVSHCYPNDYWALPFPPFIFYSMPRNLVVLAISIMLMKILCTWTKYNVDSPHSNLWARSSRIRVNGRRIEVAAVKLRRNLAVNNGCRPGLWREKTLLPHSIFQD